MVEDSIASCLRTINADMLGVVSMLASIRDVQQSSAARFAELNASRRTQLDELHAAISSQHSTLVKMAESNQMRDAQLVKHSERMDRMEILFDRLDSQLPKMTRCIEVCSEVGSSSTAIASTLTTIRDQTVTTAQTVTQRLDDMEDTIRDTFVDLKVDVINAMLTSMETTIASRFNDVDVALAKLVSPPDPAAATTPTYTLVPPDLPARQDEDTDRVSSDKPASDEDADAASSPNRFQASTTFNPGASFPAGNRVSHMRVSDHLVDGVDHGTWRQRDRTDVEEYPQYPSRNVHPAAASTHFRDGRPSQAHSQRHIGDDDGVGASPQHPLHRGIGRRDMHTAPHRDHHWSFDDREADDDDGGYAAMGGPIKSPSNIERCQQARQRGMSRYDTAALADKDYHGGVWGFDPLTIRIIKNCGYTAINEEEQYSW